MSGNSHKFGAKMSEGELLNDTDSPALSKHNKNYVTSAREDDVTPTKTPLEDSPQVVVVPAEETSGCCCRCCRRDKGKGETEGGDDKGKKCKKYCLTFVAFLFSHVGLTCCVVAYAIAGGIIFMHLESDKELANRAQVGNKLDDTVDEVSCYVFTLSILFVMRSLNCSWVNS